jgi:hypothetical protein
MFELPLASAKGFNKSQFLALAQLFFSSKRSFLAGISLG